MKVTWNDIIIAVGRFARWDEAAKKWQIYDTDGGYSRSAIAEPLDEFGKNAILRFFHRLTRGHFLPAKVVAGMSPNELRQLPPLRRHANSNHRQGAYAAA